MQHTVGYATNNPQKTDAVSPLKGKWISFKQALYTTPSSMKVEQWYQEVVSGKWTNWKKIFEYTDKGG
ncbi:MAG: hypothetical protein ACRD8W_22920 [Nitrososphaeraceae archaeon]